MTTIEKIKAEIERRITDNTFGAKLELIDILAWLDTLESEKPMNQEDELNGEIKRFVAEYGYERSEDILLIAIVARHFAEWGYLRAAEKYDEIEYNRQRAEESVPKDLEEAAHSYSESDEPLYSPGHRFHWDSDSLFGKQIETTFIAGAKWQKEQMMKEAVEGYIERDYGGQLILGRSNTPAGDEFMILGGSLFPEIHAGERREVRIIIVKEDEK